MKTDLAQEWSHSRYGAIAGRGFHYQDAVATHIAILGWLGQLDARSIIPEGHEDISVQLNDGWIHIQVKSRSSSRAGFTVGEVAGFLDTCWAAHERRSAAQPDARVVLVLERPIQDHNTPGLERVIGSDARLSKALRQQLLKKQHDPERVEQLLQNSSVIVIGDPQALSMPLLAERLHLPLAACEIHFNALENLVSRTVDANSEQPWTDAARIVLSEIERLMNEVTERLDLNALGEAFRLGICEVANFSESLNIEADQFFKGVDVLPSHVGAGLPIDRPELISQILERLGQERPVLVVGPSGAGKSAAAWMTAFASRDNIRWYRVRRLTSEDVAPLLRTVHAARPSSGSPVGLVVDDLGRSRREGWDELVKEISGLANIRLIGVAREEDLFLLRTSPQSFQVQAVLTEELAEHVWEELCSKGMTTWGDWREPFGMANGLLLEYMFILTTGDRLGNTIDEQVDRRLAESRDLELKILRLVCVADAWGSQVSLGGLRKLIGRDRDEDLQRALARLLGEHLIRESDGNFGGLHNLRSQLIIEATHRYGVPLMSETIQQAIEVLEPSQLEPFVVQAVVRGAVSEEEVVTALSKRIRNEGSPDLLASCLKALQLTSLHALALNWREILSQAGIAPARMLNIALFAVPGFSTDVLPESLQSVIDRMNESTATDYRKLLLANLGNEFINSVIGLINDPSTAAALYESLFGTVGWNEHISLDNASMFSGLSAASPSTPVRDLLRLIEDARTLCVDLAQSLVERFGGVEYLFHRIQAELPWSGGFGFTTDELGQLVVHGHVRHVAETQRDVHGDVVELCRLLLASVPEAEVASCQALNAAGGLAGYGDYAIADKRIARRRLPPQVEIEQNRARRRAFAALISTSTRTDRLLAEADLIRRLTGVLAATANFWCLRQRVPSKTRIQIIEISESLRLLAPLPDLEKQSTETVNETALPIDLADQFIEGILRVTRALLDANEVDRALTAYVGSKLLDDLEKLSSHDRWRLLSSPPFADLEQIRGVLLDLHAVMAEQQFGESNASARLIAVARNSRSLNTLERCGKAARTWATARLIASLRQIEAEFAQRSVRTYAFHRPADGVDGLYWPVEEVALIFELPSISDWEPLLPIILEARSRYLKSIQTVVVAPLREGKLVSSLSGTIISNFFPLPDVLSDWEEMTGFPILNDVTARAFRECISALSEISGIIGGRVGTLHQTEEGVIDAALSRFAQSRDSLFEKAKVDSTGLVVEAVESLKALTSSVRDQVSAFEAGRENEPELARAVIGLAQGDPADSVAGVPLVLFALTEFDIDPTDVWSRINSAIRGDQSDKPSAVSAQ